MDDEQLFVELKELYSVVDRVEQHNIRQQLQLLDNRPPRRSRTNWFEDERDQQIFAAIRKHGCKWRLISQQENLGSDDAIRNRVKRMKIDDVPFDLQNLVKRLQVTSHRSVHDPAHKPYTPEEDRIILQYLSQNTSRSVCWKALQQDNSILRHRTAHSLRNRAYRLKAYTR